MSHLVPVLLVLLCLVLPCHLCRCPPSDNHRVACLTVWPYCPLCSAAHHCTTLRAQATGHRQWRLALALCAACIYHPFPNCLTLFVLRHPLPHLPVRVHCLPGGVPH